MKTTRHLCQCALGAYQLWKLSCYYPSVWLQKDKTNNFCQLAFICLLHLHGCCLMRRKCLKMLKNSMHVYFFTEFCPMPTVFLGFCVGLGFFLHNTSSIFCIISVHCGTALVWQLSSFTDPSNPDSNAVQGLVCLSSNFLLTHFYFLNLPKACCIFQLFSINLSLLAALIHDISPSMANSDISLFSLIYRSINLQ